MEYQLNLKNRRQLLLLADLIDNELGIYAETIMLPDCDENGKTWENIGGKGGLVKIIDPIYYQIRPSSDNGMYNLVLTSELAKKIITPEVFEKIRKQI